MVGCSYKRTSSAWRDTSDKGQERTPRDRPTRRQKPPLPTSQASTQHRWRRPKSSQPCKVARQALRVLASNHHRSLRFRRIDRILIGQRRCREQHVQRRTRTETVLGNGGRRKRYRSVAEKCSVLAATHSRNRLFTLVTAAPAMRLMVTSITASSFR